MKYFALTNLSESPGSLLSEEKGVSVQGNLGLVFYTYLTCGLLWWSVGAKLREGVFNVLPMIHFILEDVLFVEEEDDGDRPQPPVVPDALKQFKRLTNTVLKGDNSHRINKGKSKGSTHLMYKQAQIYMAPTVFSSSLMTMLKLLQATTKIMAVTSVGDRESN